MVRVLVTADWQIGMQAAHVADAAPAVREARLTAARRVVEHANRLAVDALVLAGDTFENNQISYALAQRVLEILRSSRVPVFVLPGNHDPWGPDAILKKAWSHLPKHVTVLSTPDPVPIAEGSAVLYPCPATSKSSRRDPTDVIPTRDKNDVIRIGVAHGALRIESKFKEDEFPIALDSADARGLDLLVVGHWHSLFQFPTSESVRILYPGTHEQTAFDEREAGQACLVRIDAPRGLIHVESVRTGTLRWINADARIESLHDVDALEARLRAVPDPSSALVSIELSGVAPMAVLDRLHRVQSEVLPALGFLHARCRGAVAQEPSDAELDGLMTSPVLAEVVATLKDQAARDTGDAEIARAALSLLWSIESGRS